MDFVSVDIKNVPEILRDSEFFASLNKDDEEELSLPADCYYTTCVINNNTEFRFVLNTLRYWGASRCPVSVLKYYFTNKETEGNDFKCILEEFSKDLPPLVLLQKLDRSNIDSQINIYRYCARCGQLDWIEFLKSNEFKWDVSVVDAAALHGHLKCLIFFEMHKLKSYRSMFSAASGGHLPCLKYLYQTSNYWDALTVTIAIEKGNLDCLRFAIEHGCPVVQSTACAYAAKFNRMDCLRYLREIGCSIDRQSLINAASNGNLGMLQYCHQNGGCWTNEVSSAAAEHGRLDCLVYAHEQGCPWTARVTYIATIKHYTAVLEYALVHGCPANQTATRAAAEQNFLDCLKLLHEKGCPWDGDALDVAVRHDNWEVVSYLVQHGCPWKADTVDNWTKKGDAERLAKLLSHGVTVSKSAIVYAIRQRSLPCLVLLHEHGCCLKADAIAEAIRVDSVECLKYLHHHGCPWGTPALQLFYSSFSTDCIKFALENGCTFDRRENLCNECAQMGELKLLTLFREHGYPCDESTMHAACLAGRCKIVAYLLEVGCPVKIESVAKCVQHRDIEMLKAFHAHGTPWDGSLCDVAIQYRQLECLQFLHEHGCPWGRIKTNMITKDIRNTGYQAIDVAKYCLENGCGLSPLPIYMANMAAQGMLDLLQFGHENGAAWDARTCKAAIEHGYLHILQYAHEHGCPWDETSCIAAAGGGKLECLQYAHEHGCPWGSDTVLAAVRTGHLECLKYACENGCDVSKRMKQRASVEFKDTACGQYLLTLREFKVCN